MPALTTPIPQTATLPTTLPALRRAVMRAMLAPSVHNTQPWAFVAGPTTLDLFADATRRLPVIDPDSRQLVISCGAALHGARLSLAADGIPVRVELLPDPHDPDHLARIRVLSGPKRPDPDASALDRAADARHTNRRAFTAETVPDHVVSRLQIAAEREGAFLAPLTPGPVRDRVIELTATAEELQFGDPAYRAELRDWAGRSGQHGDGIPAAVLPQAARVADRLPIRGFDQHGTGRLPASAAPERDACLLVLGTDTDDPLGWLRAGQALGRILLELTRDRLVAGMFSQLSEIPRIRAQVLPAMDLIGCAHVLMRVGHAERTPPTPRRSVPDILTVSADAV